MLTIQATTGAQGLIDYFDDTLTLADYYTQEQSLMGTWHGKAAHTLGLETTPVHRDAFVALAHKHHPTDPTISLGQRTRAKSRVAYDFTFGAPKSVSLMYQLTNDKRILDAFHNSVHDAMREMEKDVQTRVRKNDAYDDRTTGNIVYASFTHTTTRDIDGSPDPHLHAHNTVFNTTYDEYEKQWKALQLVDIYRHRDYYQEIFRSQLAYRLHQLGYDVHRTKTGFELSAIDTDTLIAFSRRTQQIEQTAKDKGVKDPRHKARLGALTRDAKNTDAYTIDQLRTLWKERTPAQAQRAIATAHRTSLNASTTSPQHPDPTATHASLEHALQHGLERYNYIDARKVKAHALKHGVGNITLDSLNTALDQQLHDATILQHTIQKNTVLTTRDAILNEKAVIDYVQAGQGNNQPLAPQQRIQPTFLNDQQQAAITHVWNSPDSVIAIKGGAGTGKTTLMQEVVRGIEATKRQVYAVAPTSQAANDLATHFKATTIQRLINDPTRHAKLQNNVLWVDEAGQVDTATMKQLLAIAKEQHTRVILTGDTNQHSSVRRGDIFGTLQRETGIEVARVSTIQRQNADDYKEVVHLLSQNTEHTTKKAFHRLQEMNAIHEIPDPEERYTQIAEAYTNAKARNESVLIVAPTHREGNQVTHAIRTALKANKTITGKERTIPILKNKHYTQAEKADPLTYTDGDILQFSQNVGTIKRGEKVVVTLPTANPTTQPFVPQLRRANGEIIPLPLDRSHHFDVFEINELPLAKGDTIRITRNNMLTDANGKKHRLTNGQHYTITGFTRQGDVKLSNGVTLPHGHGNIDYGYTTTSHSAQGKTVDTVLIAQDALTGQASNREQFYVSASRGRKNVHLFTDDKELLEQHIIHSHRKADATTIKDHAINQKLEELMHTVTTATRNYAQRQRTRTRNDHEHTPQQTTPTPSHGRELFDG